jgi:hypothetical protein
MPDFAIPGFIVSSSNSARDISPRIIATILSLDSVTLSTSPAISTGLGRRAPEPYHLSKGI